MLSLTPVRRLKTCTTAVVVVPWMAAVLLVMTLACPAVAQSSKGHQTPSQVPRYTPQSPTLSPYLNLTNRNGSAASNYFGLVRPLQHQQNINERAVLQSNTQQQELQRLSQEQAALDQPTVKPTGTSGWFQDFGPNPPYKAADHYYGQWQTRSGPQRRTAPTRH